MMTDTPLIPACPPLGRFARTVVICLLAVAVPAWPDDPSASPTDSPSAKPKYSLRRLTGRVVWLNEALARRYGVQTVPESAERVLAIESKDGRLVPLIEDKRGRSFRLDKRLRGVDVELLVRQYEDAPMAQVIQIFELKDDGKYELDYWCEICAIAMFELKPCDCCQGTTELRARKMVGN